VKLRVAQAAQSDLDAIWVYIARDSGSEDAATRVIEQLLGKFHLLASFPKIGRALPSSSLEDVRTFAVGAYVIFYRLHRGTLRVLRVLHASRDAFAEFFAQ
jgi:toxin ParE1/3/4